MLTFSLRYIAAVYARRLHCDQENSMDALCQTVCKPYSH